VIAPRRLVLIGAGLLVGAIALWIAFTVAANYGIDFVL